MIELGLNEREGLSELATEAFRNPNFRVIASTRYYTFLQSLELSSTFALSTLITFFLLFEAISKATLATLLISFSL